MITESALKEVQSRTEVNVVNKNLCEIVGFSGKRVSVIKVAYIRLTVCSYVIGSVHEFAVIDDKVLPHCFQLWLEFMKKIDLDVNYNLNVHKRGCKVVTPFLTQQKKCSGSNLTICATVAKSHAITLRLEIDFLRFELEGKGETVTLLY